MKQKKVMTVELPPPEPMIPDEFDQFRDAALRFASDDAGVSKAVRPDISGLVDAVAYLEDGTPVWVPEVGETVIVEAPNPWIDTQVLEVDQVDHDNGNLKLWDPGLRQWHGNNFIMAIKQGWRFKLPPARGLTKLFAPDGGKVKFRTKRKTSKKRGVGGRR